MSYHVHPPAPPGAHPSHPPYGPAAWWAPVQPPPAPRDPKLVWALVIGGVLVAVVLVAVAVAAVSFGRAAGESIGATAGTDLGGSGGVAAPTTAPPSPAAGLGTDKGLDTYAVRCHDGDMKACDDLYDLSDPMSRYEQYGMTCAGRVKPFDVEWCTDLG